MYFLSNGTPVITCESVAWLPYTFSGTNCLRKLGTARGLNYVTSMLILNNETCLWKILWNLTLCIQLMLFVAAWYTTMGIHKRSSKRLGATDADSGPHSKNHNPRSAQPQVAQSMYILIVQSAGLSLTEVIIWYLSGIN